MTALPQHIAIIMDGNGRWAEQRHLPRIAGHRAGVDVVRKTIKACMEKKIKVLTLFAFSSENWQRPTTEVNDLMELFLAALQREVNKLHKNNVSLRIIGDISRFHPKLQEKIHEARQLTKYNTGLKLIIAANYGGKWDITCAVRTLGKAIEKGTLKAEAIDESLVQRYLTLADLPDPDLFIRTSGEQRISNFFLWQLAYTELFFCNVLWPDFTDQHLQQALDYYASRERRFGGIAEQVEIP